MRNIDDYVEKYQMEPCEEYQVKFRRKLVLSQMEKYEHSNILEIGCGMDPIFQYIDDYKSMTIVEPGTMFVDLAKKEANRMNKNVICFQGFFEDIATEFKKSGNSFDFIIVSSLLHEVEHPDLLIEAIKSVCDSNSVIHINVPNAKSLHRILAKEMGLIDEIYDLSDLQIKMQRKRVFDLNSLKKYVVEKGFDILDEGSYFPKVFSASQMKEMMQNGIVDEKIFDGLYKMIKYIPEYGSEIFVDLKLKRNNG